MVTIVTALYAEASPFIELLHLKKDTTETISQLFCGESIRVLITGPGPMAACAAVSRHFALYPPKKTDILANIGIAGLVSPSPHTIGELFLVLKLSEYSTGRTFYPDNLFQNSFTPACLTTYPVSVGAKYPGAYVPSVDISGSVIGASDSKVGMSDAIIGTSDSTVGISDSKIPPAAENTSLLNTPKNRAFLLYRSSVTPLPQLADMEATAIYQSALPYFGTERMFFLKVVSDVLSGEPTASETSSAVSSTNNLYSKKQAIPGISGTVAVTGIPVPNISSTVSVTGIPAPNISNAIPVTGISAPNSLLAPHVAKIVRFLQSAASALAAEPASQTQFLTAEEEKAAEDFLARLPLTAAVTQEFRRLLLYLKLAGASPVLEIQRFLSVLPAQLPHGKKNIMPLFEQFKTQVLRTPSVLSSYPASEEDFSSRSTANLSDQTECATYLPFFSTIYLEEGLFTDGASLRSISKAISDIEVSLAVHKTNHHVPYEQPDTINFRFLTRLAEEKKINLITIKHYKDVFNRSHQHFALQKKSPSLILAKNTGTLIYPGAPVCQNFGNQHFYYTSQVMNCVYHCDYCYLQGMYPSANLVLFVNLEDYFAELASLLQKHPVYLCISYDTDLLAMEPLFGMVQRWLEFVKSNHNLTIEIRTKSGNPILFQQFAKLLKPSLHEACNESYRNSCDEPCILESPLFPLPSATEPPASITSRVIFAWTVSPETVVKSCEHGAASLSGKLKALNAAKSAGFPVRLCFDPMIYTPDWEHAYAELVHQVFSEVSPDALLDVSIGVFRISSDYLKQLRKCRPDSAVAQFPYQSKNGVSHYGILSEKMVKYMQQLLSAYLPEEKIFIWKEENTL